MSGGVVGAGLVRSSGGIGVVGGVGIWDSRGSGGSSRGRVS